MFERTEPAAVPLSELPASRPPAGCLAIWWARIPDAPHDEARLAQSLSGRERARLERIRDPATRRGSFVARWVCRQILGAALGIAASDVPLLRGTYGKPLLAAPHDALHFNDTHSGDWVVVAATWAGPVGVDVERMRPRPLDKLVRRYFSEHEQAAWAALEAEDREPAFYRAWCCKEAVGKAAGTGISRRILSQTVTDMHAGGSSMLRATPEGFGAHTGWQTQDLAAGPGYAGIVAVRSDGCLELRHYRLEF